MRIVDVRERTVSIASPIRNAFMDFGQMTNSFVAIVTNNLDAIVRALETAGVEFVPDNGGGAGVRFRKSGEPR